jgi:hypothetical protein
MTESDVGLLSLVGTVETAASVADGVEASAGITLIVGGSIISGDMVGGRQWWAEEAAKVRSAAPTDGSPITDVAVHATESIAKVFDVLKQTYETAESDYTLIPHIHLKNVTFLSTGHPLSTRVSMRIRIADVQGWSFSRVNVS